MTADDFRALCLALPGTLESSHMGAPDFRANGRIFATLAAQAQGKAMVKLPLEEQAMRLEAAPDTFTPVPGGWGRMGCTHVILATADEPAVRGSLQLAYEVQMAKPKGRNRKSKT